MHLSTSNVESSVDDADRRLIVYLKMREENDNVICRSLTLISCRRPHLLFEKAAKTIDLHVL